MAEEQKAPMWVALLAGALVLGTGPLALALIVALSPPEEFGVGQSFAELVRDGGPFSYAVLFAGALASLLGAILAAVSVRRPGLPAPLALIPFLLASLAALIGVVFGMRQVMAAIAHVAPADSGVILMAAIGELTSLSVQSLAFAAAGCVCVALAAVVSLGAAPRGARVLTLIGAGVLGACLAVMTAQGLSVREGFRAVGYASPADRLTIFLSVVQQWRELNQLANGLFLASLAIAIAGGAILIARNQRAAGIGAAASLVVAAIGFRGFNSMAERQASSADLPPSSRLLVVQGLEPSMGSFIQLSDEPDLESVDYRVAQRLSHPEMGEAPRVSVELDPSLEPKTLLRVLQVAHLSKASWVELIGEAPHKKLEVPPLFAGAADVMNHVPLAAPLRVLFTGEVCEKCVPANLSETGLQVGEEAWTPKEEADFTGAFDELSGVEVSFVEDPEQLARAAMAALAHRHLLVVRVPLPDPMPQAGGDEKD